MTDQESHRMEKNISVGDKYGPGMAITDPTEATAYFEKCVAHTMSWGKSREEAEDIERQNFGYYAGYYSDETRARVEKLFRCSHPVFGAIRERGAPTSNEALTAGMSAAAGR